MSSDSDRTIDSDELEQIIACAKEEQKHNTKQVHPNVLKRLSEFHGLSDSDSDDKSKVRKTETKKDKSKVMKTKAKKNTDLLSEFHGLSDSDSDDKSKARKTEIENDKSKVMKTKAKQNTGQNKMNLSDSDTGTEKSKVKMTKTKKDLGLNRDNRPHCQYGSKCYRKNPAHKKEFYHPSSDSRNSLDKPSSPSNSSNKSNRSSVSGNLHYTEKCKMYQFFVNHVTGIPPRYNIGVSYNIRDLLSLEDGTLVASAQFNYMFDIPWLVQQYPEKYRKCPLTIIHGEQRGSKTALERSGIDYPNIKFCQAKLDIPFGTHHTKMMFLLYKEGFRVVIHTSNIVQQDWAQKTQGMWISHLLPEMKKSCDSGDSPTNFKSDLLDYIASYGIPQLEEWQQVIKRHDFSQVRIVLIGSVPGRHVGSRKTTFGHLKLRKVLNLNGPSKDTVKNDWIAVGQFSSIGSLGSNPEQWLCTEFASSLVTCKDTSLSPKSSCLKLIYPSVENVRKSLEGYPAGASLPYSIKVAQKQPYLNSFLHQWKSEKLGRSEASPHIKTYLRLSPDCKKIAWFLVTSANLSKAAWGALEKKGSQFMIRSYELGVLYLPKYFDLETFSSPLKGDEDFFPVPYDIPLEPYTSQDVPWIWDIPQTKGPDRFGNMWCPPPLRS